MFQEVFEQAGLSESEAEVYDAILILDRGTPSQISKRTHTTRENTYRILNKLESLGLVSVVEESKQLTYKAETPKKLMSILDKKDEDLKSTLALLKQAVKDLKSQMSVERNKPVVKYYEGEEGFRKAYFETLEKPDVMQYEIVHRFYGSPFKKWLDTVFIPERVRRNIGRKMVIASNKEAEELVSRDNTEIRESYFIEKESFPQGTSIISDENTVILTSSGEYETGNVAGIVIKHEIITAAINSLVKHIWEDAKRKEGKQ